MLYLFFLFPQLTRNAFRLLSMLDNKRQGERLKPKAVDHTSNAADDTAPAKVSARKGGPGESHGTYATRIRG